ncbi:hypothetical protein [Streptomyces lanatus]|uniref:Uncharacterized protein n=1 Tax=Streptomyces lanatus TaxID=66900 RepID=A0ABV1XIW3_9ACTN|nr:hypothetical protein [Streptomyces lanatus]GHG92004.1 hypothetical protein GCM10018780_13170 [Streptomyces lanatus]
MSESRPPNPFPAPAPAEWQERWIDAVLSAPGVNVPRDALENIAPFIVRPKDSLTDADSEGQRRLKPSRLRTVRTDAGEMVVLLVRMNGVGGVVWEHNERISSTWHSAADPATAGAPRRSLTRVLPWTRTTEDGREKVFAALESRTETLSRLLGNVEQAAAELDNRDGRRTYNLGEDLVLNGQHEPCMYVAQHFRVDEEIGEDADGKPLHPSAYWGWMAVRGNNRTRRRQEIFDISSAEVLTGVPFKKLGSDGEGVAVNPGYWLRSLAQTLNGEFAALTEQPDPDARAHRALKIAEVEAHLVVGSPTPARLFRTVQVSNRRDHVHPPLEFTPNDQGRALGRSVLGAYVAQGVLDEATADVLSGAAPVSELPGAPAGASVSTLRDLRSMCLLRELFPVDQRKREIIRRALSEGPPSLLNSREVNLRARAWSALTSESYPQPWNPRIAEVFPTAKARAGFAPSERPLEELLAAADTDPVAFEELIMFRAAHWLAAFDIIDADRGSLTGQKTVDDDGTEAERVRRTVKNNLYAMQNNPAAAVSLLRELALAMDEGRKPRKVSVSGEVLDGAASRAWFNRTFPKETGTRPYTRRTLEREHPTTLRGGRTTLTLDTLTDPLAEPAEAASAHAPVETDAQAVERLARELETQINAMADGATEIGELLTELQGKADAAGMEYALTRQQADDTVLGLAKTLSELRKWPEVVPSMGRPN